MRYGDRVIHYPINVTIVETGVSVGGYSMMCVVMSYRGYIYINRGWQDTPWWRRSSWKDDQQDFADSVDALLV